MKINNRIHDYTEHEKAVPKPSIDIDIKNTLPSSWINRYDLLTMAKSCSSSTSSSSLTSSTLTQPIPIRSKPNNIPIPSLVMPTIDGYVVSHSLLVNNMSVDSYGFMLDERYGAGIEEYREVCARYVDKLERQMQRWVAIVPVARGGVVVFPPSGERIKRALRKGLPREIRPMAWFYYSGAQSRQDAEPKRYVELVRIAQNNLNAPLYNQIESDVSHTFANNRRFRTMTVISPFVEQLGTTNPAELKSHAALQRILLATAYAFPTISYTNGLNCVAATLLLVTENEQWSFWILYSILSSLLPDNFYTDMNLGCNVDQDVLGTLLAWKLPAVYQKLQQLEMSLHIVTSSWFTHLFVDQLPFETTIRVWDTFLHEGNKVLLRIAVALFKLNQETLLTINDPFELARFIRNMPKGQLDAVKLLHTAFNGIGGFSKSWLDDERKRVIPFWKAKHAVRRFSRVSPAYCHAPSAQANGKNRSSVFTPAFLVASSEGLAHKTVENPVIISQSDNNPSLEESVR